MDLRIRVGSIILKKDKILLIAHEKDREIYWLIPGGGVDFGESLEDALKRELREELNIEVKVGKPCMLFDSIEPNGSRHIVNIYFVSEYVGGDFKLWSDSILHDYKYFSYKELSQVKMYPPINRELSEMFNKNLDDLDNIYMGKIWLKK